MKTIIVNDVAASSGGALSILRQFLAELKNNEVAKSYRWIVFVSNDLVNEYNDVHIEIVRVDAKKWRKRIWWDTYGICKWLQDRHIKPLLAVSLMSVGFRYLKICQIIYIHQSLPYGDFNDFKWFEWKTRLYTWGIEKWMMWSIKRDSTIVVQSNWMKEAVSKKLRISKNQIHVIRPNIEPLAGEELRCVNNKSYYLFYPAVASASYKNHELLIKVLSTIKKKKPELYPRITLAFTCNPDDNRITKYYYRLSKKLSVDERIEWKGYLSKDEMLREYIQSDIVLFPSKLETFGLPLIEAASLGKQVLVLDKVYSHDVLKSYSGATFLEEDVEEWLEAVVRCFEGKRVQYDPLNQDNSDGWKQLISLIMAVICRIGRSNIPCGLYE